MSKKKRPLPDPRGAVWALLRILAGTVFVVSGFGKLMEPTAHFESVIREFRVLPQEAIGLAAWGIPWVEFIGGVFFVLGLWRGFFLGLLWILNSVFLGVLLGALWRKLPIQTCGCFGEAFQISIPVMIGIDGLLWFCFLLLSIFFIPMRSWSLDHRWDSSS